MNPTVTKSLNWAMIVLAFGVAAWLSPRMPELVPVHWDAHGNVNGYMRKPLGVYILPLAMLGLHGLLTVSRRALLRELAIASFSRVYDLLNTAILAFLLFITVLALRAATGERVPILRGTFVAVGLLLIVMGNLLGKVTRNFFVGIRTPWTLANDEVWFRTHRLGGKVFVVAGALVVLGVCAGASIGLCAAIALLAGIVPIVYSYFAYRRLEGRPH
jgi:uncharacterized membrane protein